MKFWVFFSLCFLFNICLRRSGLFFYFVCFDSFYIICTLSYKLIWALLISFTIKALKSSNFLLTRMNSIYIYIYYTQVHAIICAVQMFVFICLGWLCLCVLIGLLGWGIEPATTLIWDWCSGYWAKTNSWIWENLCSVCGIGKEKWEETKSSFCDEGGEKLRKDDDNLSHVCFRAKERNSLLPNLYWNVSIKFGENLLSFLYPPDKFPNKKKDTMQNYQILSFSLSWNFKDSPFWVVMLTYDLLTHLLGFSKEL